jgi:hypothetical protein
MIYLAIYFEEEVYFKEEYLTCALASFNSWIDSLGQALACYLSPLSQVSIKDIQVTNW